VWLMQHFSKCHPIWPIGWKAFIKRFCNYHPKYYIDLEPTKPASFSARVAHCSLLKASSANSSKKKH
jgi:hypothetical protein